MEEQELRINLGEDSFSFGEAELVLVVPETIHIYGGQMATEVSRMENGINGGGASNSQGLFVAVELKATILSRTALEHTTKKARSILFRFSVFLFHKRSHSRELTTPAFN